MTFEAALARLRFLAGKKFDAGCVDAIEKAAAAGRSDSGQGRRASVAARQADADPVAPAEAYGRGTHDRIMLEPLRMRRWRWSPDRAPAVAAAQGQSDPEAELQRRAEPTCREGRSDMALEDVQEGGQR